MDGANAATSLGVLLQIVFLDLLLSGDNAVVIALACRRLPPEQARRAAWLGAGGAILFRLILTSITAWLIELPFLQFLSALPLLVIAMNLMNDHGQHHLPHPAAEAAKGGMVAAAGIIIISDATMSVDNVVALAAVSEGKFWLLAFGLALSIPMIVFGSFGFTRLMRAFPLLVDLGAALLGWVAGAMIVADPLFRSWAATQAPALGVALPLACAIFVLAQGRFARERERSKRLAAVQQFVATRPGVAELAKDTLDENDIRTKWSGDTLNVLREDGAPIQAPDFADAALSPAGEQADLCERPLESAAVVPLPVRSEAPAEETSAEKADEPPEAGDRWMVLGLVALFVVFGLFLTVTMLIPD
jgi:YjbE family integral membrane protein